jgi:hypothetical protein
VTVTEQALNKTKIPSPPEFRRRRNFGWAAPRFPFLDGDGFEPSLLLDSPEGGVMEQDTRYVSIEGSRIPAPAGSIKGSRHYGHCLRDTVVGGVGFKDVRAYGASEFVIPNAFVKLDFRIDPTRSDFGEIISDLGC